jgi:type IV secretion system protein VirB4
MVTRPTTAHRQRREVTLATQIPYTAQVSEHVVRTRAGHYVQVLTLGGISFECADDQDLNIWHSRLNVLWRSVASPQVAIWTHVIRLREYTYPSGTFPSEFATSLDSHYRHRIAGERLMRMELYLSLVYRPTTGAITGLASKLLHRTRQVEPQQERTDALEACTKLRQTAEAALDRYEARALGVYERGGRQFSEVLEFLAFLIDGRRRPMPLVPAPLYNFLGTSRPSFGSETLELRSETETTMGAILGIKEYATPTTPGLLNSILSAPFPLILSQSFAFLNKASAQGLLLRQHNRMLNSGDFSVSQAEELKDALDGLTSGDFVMGDHHLTMLVLSDSTTDVGHDAAKVQHHALADRIAVARDYLADAGFIVAREDLALEAAYWAQLPGNFSFRPRKAPITSRNFAGMNSLHSHPCGRTSGYHWGDATTLFITSAGSAYHYGLHASDPNDPDGGSRKDIGHTFICGPTGSGKTVFVGFVISMLSRQGVTQIIFDKDRGLEILVRALGGHYLALRNGQPTGFNPLQLEPNPSNMTFLKQWLSIIARAGTNEPLTIRQQSDLDQALQGTLSLDRPLRRLSRLIEFLDVTDLEGPYARLAPWCASVGGDLHWAFDNETDSVVGILEGTPTLGFDGTDFLNNTLILPAVSFYLFHLIRALVDGRRLVLWADEFSKWLGEVAFTDFARDSFKTWRKLNAVLCAATQSPSDALQSPIARTIIEQTPTKIIFPNSDANRDEYVDGLGLSEREFMLIKEELLPGSRCFLIKRGRNSVVCQLDLKGFGAELSVISGRSSNVEYLTEVIERLGADPGRWLHEFCDRFGGLYKTTAVAS